MIWPNVRVNIWISCLELYTRSIICLLIMFSKVTDFSIQDRKRKYRCLMWIPKVLRDEIYLHALHHHCHQVTSHLYIYSKSIGNGKVYKQRLLICVSGWSAHKQMQRKTIHSSGDRSLSLTYTIVLSVDGSMSAWYRYWMGLQSILIQSNQPIERGQRAEW